MLCSDNLMCVPVYVWGESQQIIWHRSRSMRLGFPVGGNDAWTSRDSGISCAGCLGRMTVESMRCLSESKSDQEECGFGVHSRGCWNGKMVVGRHEHRDPSRRLDQEQGFCRERGTVKMILRSRVCVYNIIQSLCNSFRAVDKSDEPATSSSQDIPKLLLRRDTSTYVRG